MTLSGARVLVTGGAGFIGSELVAQLAAIGCDVVIVDNLATGRRENVPSSSRVRLRVADIRDTSAMADALDGIDLVFHLACLGVRHSIHSPHENHLVNADATLTLLSLASDADVQRFVHVSSSEVYGTARLPVISEAHPTFPSTVYGASKLAGECYARAFRATYGFPAVIVRPFNAFGPRSHHEGDSGEVIPRFMLRAMAGRPLVVFGDGTQTRDFTFVSDTASAVIAAAEAEAAVGETINVGSGEAISILDLARRVSDVVGRPLDVVHEQARPGDVHDLRADASKARSLLGFAPTVSLDEGLRRLHEWYTRQPQSPAELLEQERLRNWTPA